MFTTVNKFIHNRKNGKHGKKRSGVRVSSFIFIIMCSCYHLVFFSLIGFFLIFAESKQKPEQFTTLLKNVLLKKFGHSIRKRSNEKNGYINNMDNKIDAVNARILNGVNHKNINHILVTILSLSLDNFLSIESEFFRDIEQHVANVKCEVSEVSALNPTSVLIYWFCYYQNSEIANPKWNHMFVPSHKLERLLTSGEMRGFLQKYNVTKFYQKEEKLRYNPTTSTSKEHWYLMTVVALTSTIVIILASLLVICCKREKKNHVVLKESFNENDTVLKKERNNSFATSPRKVAFSYSPKKTSTPVFSFSSPLKTVDKVILPVQSPIEMAGPFTVQPQLDLLYPAKPGFSMKWSENSSLGGNGSKNKSLFQSRRGSSASLVITLSPRTPDAEESFIMHESPTEEILLRKSRCIKYRELCKLKDNDKELTEEFWSIPPNTICRREMQLKNSLKNRYPEILPNSRSLVRLKSSDNSSVYINANFIKGYNGEPNQFIATQGPLLATIEDFWLMIWQYNCSIIVMLTKLKERNKEKCVQYWPCPETVSQQIYGDITVTYDSEIDRHGYKIMTMYISHKGSDETRKVVHFWFTSWPDHNIPKKCHQIVSLVKEVRNIQTQQGAPLVVHCSAGRGRTGCFIALFLGMSQIDEEKEVDVLKIVSQMRMERGGMVDKDQQYVFIYKALFEYWSCKNHNSSSASPLLSTNNAFTNFDSDSDLESFVG
ncbi:receptor-type tyrosine-protein phosphatase R isoform X1 [Hydra vulgaris]|uniref:receptor-type tyrosine-protein phosphatase R isoform X1 n=1 Tax=Hydra vulgaris TaxID=6087 RepID=UPI001F5FA345|nr:receptor-type tyrosine-protein phosphatase R-like isoform X1 [Hydra vulgaris]